MKEGFYMLKARKGLIKCKAMYDEKAGVIYSVEITGDFFLYPEDVIEELTKRLRNVKIDRRSIKDIIESLYREYKISSPGLSVDDIVEVVYLAAGGSNE